MFYSTEHLQLSKYLLKLTFLEIPLMLVLLLENWTLIQKIQVQVLTHHLELCDLGNSLNLFKVSSSRRDFVIHSIPYSLPVPEVFYVS